MTKTPHITADTRKAYRDSKLLIYALIDKIRIHWEDSEQLEIHLAPRQAQAYVSKALGISMDQAWALIVEEVKDSYAQGEESIREADKDLNDMVAEWEHRAAHPEK